MTPKQWFDEGTREGLREMTTYERLMLQLAIKQLEFLYDIRSGRIGFHADVERECAAVITRVRDTLAADASRKRLAARYERARRAELGAE